MKLLETHFVLGKQMNMKYYSGTRFFRDNDFGLRNALASEFLDRYPCRFRFDTAETELLASSFVRSRCCRPADCAGPLIVQICHETSALTNACPALLGDSPSPIGRAAAKMGSPAGQKHKDHQPSTSSNLVVFMFCICWVNRHAMHLFTRM